MTAGRRIAIAQDWQAYSAATRDLAPALPSGSSGCWSDALAANISGLAGLGVADGILISGA